MAAPNDSAFETNRLQARRGQRSIRRHVRWIRGGWQAMGYLQKTTGAPWRRLSPTPARTPAYELVLSTVTARRFCDQHEMSLQTATGRSLPYEIVRMRCAWMPRDVR